MNRRTVVSRLAVGAALIAGCSSDTGGNNDDVDSTGNGDGTESSSDGAEPSDDEGDESNGDGSTDSGDDGDAAGAGEDESDGTTDGNGVNGGNWASSEAIWGLYSPDHPGTYEYTMTIVDGAGWGELLLEVSEDGTVDASLTTYGTEVVHEGTHSGPWEDVWRDLRETDAADFLGPVLVPLNGYDPGQVREGGEWSVETDRGVLSVTGDESDQSSAYFDYRSVRAELDGEFDHLARMNPDLELVTYASWLDAETDELEKKIEFLGRW